MEELALVPIPHVTQYVEVATNKWLDVEAAANKVAVKLTLQFQLTVVQDK